MQNYMDDDQRNGGDRQPRVDLAEAMPAHTENHEKMSAPRRQEELHYRPGGYQGRHRNKQRYVYPEIQRITGHGVTPRRQVIQTRPVSSTSGAPCPMKGSEKSLWLARESLFG